MPRYPLTIVDGNGNDVVFDSAPERIVAYDASAVETLFAIGEGDRVVGTHSFVFFPPEVADIPKLGGAFSIDVEATVALAPDLVYIFFPTFNDQLESAGLKVLYLQTLNDDFRQMADRFRVWGELLDAEDSAEAVADDFDDRVAAIESTLLSQPDGPSVFWDAFQLFTPGPDTLIGEVLDLLKLQNIAFDVSGFEQFSPELLVARDPDIIFTFDAASFTDNPAYSEVSAVQTGQILPTEDLLSIDGPRFVEGIEELASAVYPELFP